LAQLAAGFATYKGITNLQLAAKNLERIIGE